MDIRKEGETYIPVFLASVANDFSLRRGTVENVCLVPWKWEPKVTGAFKYIIETYISCKI